MARKKELEQIPTIRPGDRVLRRELEQDGPNDSGYRVVGAGEEAELVMEDPTEEDFDDSEDM